MENLFNEKESKAFVLKFSSCDEELALRVYTSRLIGGNPDLVLHGGGNTSVKLNIDNVVGEKNDAVYVKGSGIDLSTIAAEDFTGLLLSPLRKLRVLQSLSEDEMENQLNLNRISIRSPRPSVEALLHVFLPHKFVDHTHADSILILTHQKDGAAVVKAALGNNVAVIPYAMSGLPLARVVVEAYERNPAIEAIVIINHGIFTFAENARASYDKMIDFVTRAEDYINRQIKKRSRISFPPELSLPANDLDALTRCVQIIRGSCAHVASDGERRRFFVETRNRPDMIAAASSQEAEAICRSGVLTPDHVIHAKNAIIYIESVPENDSDLRMMINRAVENYRNDYHLYYREQVKSKNVPPAMLDPVPSLFLVAGVGLFALGVTRNAARICADIGEHTLRAKLVSQALGAYVPIDPKHIFDMEYWGLQQRKTVTSAAKPLQGQVAVITGGGGAIGFGISERLLAAGAAVAISDIDPLRLGKAFSLLTEKYDPNQVERIVFDVTDYPAVKAAFEEISRRFGGIDIVVPNAGIAHVAKIEDLEPDKLDQVLSVNLKGTFNAIKASVPIFKRQATGGNIVVISSKNVFDPGAAFGAYSASKAGAHQIAKIAALEMAELGVRVNMINPDAVFGDENVCSGLWETVGPDRMKSRGISPDQLKDYYCQRSLLKVQVLAEHVGNAVVFFASDLTPTTGAALPVDGGNPSAFPR